MAREYPRFLFSNPTNTKSPGPFIIHTLSPACIIRVDNFGGKKFNLEVLEVFDKSFSPSDLLFITKEAKKWLAFQIQSKSITF